MPNATKTNKMIIITFVIARPDSILAKISTAAILIIVRAAIVPTANATYATGLVLPVIACSAYETAIASDGQ